MMNNFGKNNIFQSSGNDIKIMRSTFLPGFNEIQ